MKVLVVLACLCLSAWAVPTAKLFTTIEELYGDNARIIQGSPAYAGQFPWQAAVRFQTPYGESFCGGALISDQWVLTAAHCTTDAISFRIFLGGTQFASSAEGLEIETTTYIRHEGYNAYLNNDVALVKLPKPVVFTDKIKAIKLPSRGQVVGPNESVTVSGWGKTSDSTNVVSPSLNFVELTTITNQRCADVYGPITIASSTLCAVGHPSHSTCNGDSGGPLVQNIGGEAVHVGVVSFVHNSGCASGKPSGYMRTASFLDWIARNTGLNV